MLYEIDSRDAIVSIPSADPPRSSYLILFIFSEHFFDRKVAAPV
jgi:hypothetical protein